MHRVFSSIGNGECPKIHQHTPAFAVEAAPVGEQAEIRTGSDGRNIMALTRTGWTGGAPGPMRVAIAASEPVAGLHMHTGIIRIRLITAPRYKTTHSHLSKRHLSS